MKLAYNNTLTLLFASASLVYFHLVPNFLSHLGFGDYFAAHNHQFWWILCALGFCAYSIWTRYCCRDLHIDLIQITLAFLIGFFATVCVEVVKIPSTDIEAVLFFVGWFQFGPALILSIIFFGFIKMFFVIFHK